MELRPRQPSEKGPADWFTGDVWIDPITRGEPPSRIRVIAVRFTPGARTAWHAHALGQTLFVTDGAGRAQSRGGEILDLRAGDVVYTPPNEWHWHGATPEHFMSHFSMTEGIGGDRPETDWGKHVTDGEYRGEATGDPAVPAGDGDLHQVEHER